MKFPENVHLIAIYKKMDGFISGTHLCQKLLAKNTEKMTFPQISLISI
jgi:hypothetical protein